MSTVRELQSQVDGTSSESEEMKQRISSQEKQLQQLDAIYEENKLLQQKCIELDDNRISECLLIEPRHEKTCLCYL